MFFFCRKKFRTRGFKDYPPVMSGDFSFDPVADQRYVENQAPYNGNPDPRLRLGGVCVCVCVCVYVLMYVPPFVMYLHVCAFLCHRQRDIL